MLPVVYYAGLCMDDLQTIIGRVAAVQNGFVPIRAEAERLVAGHSTTDSLSMARTLLEEQAYQARALGTFVLGKIAHEAPEAFALLLESVSHDPDWRVQEILAMAFDSYCANIGYEAALPVIEQWMAHSNPNVRRAASEGLRIWTARPYFREHAQVAIALLSRLKADKSEYVRKSAGNALRDISRKYGPLVKDEVGIWDLSDKRVAHTYKLAARFLD